MKDVKHKTKHRRICNVDETSVDHDDYFSSRLWEM